MGSIQQSLTPSEVNKDAAINPANSREEHLAAVRATRSKIPMGLPMTKLGAPDIPGYSCNWFNDEDGRVEWAISRGYRFVEQHEIVSISNDIAGDLVGVGTDMGSRVSQVVGGSRFNTPLKAFLMKIPTEIFEEDKQAEQDRVDDIHEGMKQGRQKINGERADDMNLRYVKSVSTKSTYSRRG